MSSFATFLVKVFICLILGNLHEVYFNYASS